MTMTAHVSLSLVLTALVLAPLSCLAQVVDSDDRIVVSGEVSATITDDQVAEFVWSTTSTSAQLLKECFEDAPRCHLSFDGICDAGEACPAGSDCFDCDTDPCREHDFDCKGCIGNAAGCSWCPGDALCVSHGGWGLDVFASVDKLHSCPMPNDWKQTCDPLHDDNVFTDPLYDAMKWAYQLIDVEPVWRDFGVTGEGVHVRINDDGVDALHPEFANRFNVEHSCEEYMPVGDHGTAMASLILAEADNDECAVGIAPGATISSCIVLNSLGQVRLLEVGDSLTHSLDVVDISSNSWGPLPCKSKNARQRRFLQGDDDDCPFLYNHTANPCEACSEGVKCIQAVSRYCRDLYEMDPEACNNYLDYWYECDYDPLPVNAGQALAKGTTEGRNGLGIIYVWAAGNQYKYGVDANMDPFVQSRFTISVASVGKDGLHSSFSTPGEANLVAAPGGDYENIRNNIVAKPGGGCQNRNGGTSYAAPTAAGVIALMLQQNPLLGWRDVQGILVATAQVVDQADSSWVTNGAGLAHSTKYGFGIVDAFAAVNASVDWVNWSEEQEILVESGIIGLPIENDRPSSATSVLVVGDVADGFVTESVAVYLALDHFTRGDLLITLESPSGTVSVLHPGKRPESSVEAVHWKLTTVKNWMEDPVGNWTLRITDEKPSVEGVVGECRDYEYRSPVVSSFSGNVYRYRRCSEMSGTYCWDGVIFDDIVYEWRDENNGELSAAGACCICGGGVTVPEEETLVSWNMIVYGHYERESPPSAVSRQKSP